MAQRIAEQQAGRIFQDFVGRGRELESLKTLLISDGPKVAHVHGIAGIGKSSLLEVFGAQARAAGAAVIGLDCRATEPTAVGFIRELAEAIGADAAGLHEVTARLGELGPRVILALDTYDVFRLLDTWLRQVFVPALPGNVRLVCLGREKPLPAWRTDLGWRGLFKPISLELLAEEEAEALLRRVGLEAKAAARIAHITHGHPLALQLAASVHAERPDLVLEEASLQQALDELTHMFVDDVRDVATRRALEATSVVRRITISILRAILPDLAPRDVYERLRALPFVEVASDGLFVHDAVREAIGRSLRASDPSRYLACQKAAWRQLREETQAVGRGELWRYTADMLYLIENPVVREAFFPSGTQRLAVEPATSADAEAIAAIVEAHEGSDAAHHLLRWWRRLPQSFSVVRGRDHQVIGLCCRLLNHGTEPAWLIEDPITFQWWGHLKRHPLSAGQSALFCRRWLSLHDGEVPSEVQAAVWLDLKRAYMELRPALRRVYLAVNDLDPYAPVATRLGFQILADREVALDGRSYHSAVLDFGPASVDGWLAGLAAAELGIAQSALLDPEARELVFDGERVSLTPLEFGVMKYLDGREGKAVSRSELLKDVWDTSYFGGSNVVDTVIRSLRRKLGPHAKRIETVTGVGYRLRP